MKMLAPKAALEPFARDQVGLGARAGQPVATASARSVTRPVPAAAKRVVQELFAALAARGVRYCHWKSNVRLAETLAGSEDIDLLVRREDAGLLQAVLAETGFKLCGSRSGAAHPGTFNALALDEASGE